MIRLQLFLLPFLVLSNLGASSVELTEATIYQHSQFWPPKVTLTQSVDSKLATVKPGQSGVLIRLENDGEVILDLGRDGILRVPMETTDMLTQAKAIQIGQQEKQYPNWVMMVGRGLMRTGEEAKPIRIPLRDFEAYERFIVIYLAEGADYPQELRAVFAEKREWMEEEGWFPMVMAANVPGGNAGLAEILGSDFDPGGFLQTFLVEAYMRSLHHEPEEFPYIVLTDMEGKTIARQLPNESANEALIRLIDAQGSLDGKRRD